MTCISNLCLAITSVFGYVSLQRYLVPKPLEYCNMSLVGKCLCVESGSNTYLLAMFEIIVMLVPPPLLKTASGNTSSIISVCLTPNGLPKILKSLRYSFLALGVSPKRAKNTRAKKGLIHSSQYAEANPHLNVDHTRMGRSTGFQSEWVSVQPW